MHITPNSAACMPRIRTPRPFDEKQRDQLLSLQVVQLINFSTNADLILKTFSEFSSQITLLKLNINYLKSARSPMNKLDRFPDRLTKTMTETTERMETDLFHSVSTANEWDWKYEFHTILF